MSSYSCARLEDCFELHLNNPSKWTLQGHSKAGERTGFLLKELNIIFDCGLATNKKSIAVFLTHAHTDHSFELPNIINRRDPIVKGQEHLYGKAFILPQEAYLGIEKLLDSVIFLSDGIVKQEERDLDPMSAYQQLRIYPICVNYGDKLSVPGLKNIEVEILYADHTVQSVGYGLSSLRKKLKPEYFELTKTKEGIKQLKELRQNTETEYYEQIYEMAFYCDSSIKNLTEANEWKKYPVVVVECTGFSPTYTPEQMEKIKHSHYDVLVPIMRQHKDKQWILIHTSMSVSIEYLKELENNLKLEDINATFFGM